jgi:hypothetical protein
MKKITVIPVFIALLLATRVLATSGPVGWWKFDEGTGTNIFDSSTNGNNGFLEGGSLSSCWIEGILSNALQFGGVTTNWVTIPYNASLVPTQAFTLTAWVKPPTNNEFDIENWDDSYNGNYLLEVFPYGASFSLSSTGGFIAYPPYPYVVNWVTNTWHHFAGVYTGTNAILYVDGSEAGTMTVTGGITPVPNPLIFGWPDPLYDQGSADDIRLYDRALSSNEVAALFNVDSIGDGIPDWWRQQYFGSAATTNSSSCASCDPDGDGYSNLQEYNAGTVPTNSASFPSSIPPNLVLWWKLDEGSGTNISDSALNGNDGLLEGGSLSSCWTSGILSNALRFGGITTNWVSVPYNPSLVPTQAFTVAAWVFPPTNNEFDIENWDAFNNGNYLIEVFPNSASFLLSSTGGGIYSADFTTNMWHHFAGVYTGTNALLYVDGNCVGTMPVTGGITPVHNPFIIGWPDQLYDQGSADDIRLYNRALSSNEVVALFLTPNAASFGDGIPNWWRQQYFGSAATTNSSSCATCDPDGDGYSNLQEYNAGTDPTNPSSYPLPVLPFTNNFVRTNPPRIIMPNNNYTGFFTAGQTNNIYTTDGSPLTVWKIVGSTFSNIYNGGGTNISLICTQGWYCIQSADDRSQFGVLRPGFSRGSYSVMDSFGAPVLEDYDSWWPVYTAYTNTLPAYSREDYLWSDFEPNKSNFYWTVVDSNTVFDVANGERIVGNCTLRPGWQTNDADFVAEWQYAVSNLFAHFGTNLYSFLIWNEPYGSTFTNFSAISYETNNLGNYPTNLVSGYTMLGNEWGQFDPAYSPWWDTNGWYVTGADTNSWEAFYLELVEAAYAAKNATHSQVQLIAGVTVGSTSYQTSFLYWKSHGLSNYVQGVACHMNSNLQFSDFPTNSAYVLSTLQEMQFFATNFPTLGIWEDEAHLIGDSALTGQAYTNSSEQQAGAVDTLNWWTGYNRGVKDRLIYAVFGAYVNNYLLWFNPQDMFSTNCCQFDSDIEVNGWEPGRGIKLKDAAYLTVEDILAGATSLCMTNDTNSVLVAWSKGGQSTLCFWTGENAPAFNTSLPSVTDVFGNPVPALGNDMPIFWTTNASSTVALSNAWNSIHSP